MRDTQQMLKMLPFDFKICGSIFCLFALISFFGQGARSVENRPDTVFLNGKIYTVDENRRWVEALAVAEKKIISLGTNKDISALAGPNTRFVDLAGHMVMPGIHDAHTHLLFAGLKWTEECRLPPTGELKKIVAQLESCAERKRKSEWIVAGEFNPNLFSEPLDKQFLDQAFPNRPVYLYDYSIHHALVNSAALKKAGINADTIDPPYGKIERNPITGDATGNLVEMATVLVSQVIPSYSDETYRQALDFAIRRCHAFGITSIQESSATRRLLKLYNDLDRANALNLSVTAHIVWNSQKWGEETPQQLDELINQRHAFSTEHVDVDAVKLWLDGAPLPPHFSEVRINSKTQRPEARNLLVRGEKLTKKLEEWKTEGIKAKIHAAGSGSVRVALDAIELIYNESSKEYSRLPEIAHNNLISSVDIERYGRLGVVAEMSPAIWHLGSVPGFKVVNAWFPFNSLVKAGALVTIGSDWILTPDPNLFPALAGAVTRTWESVGLSDAIDMMTRNGAKSVGRLDRFGSLEVGKLANFIVLDRHLFAIDPKKIEGTKILLTIFEGQPVYLNPGAPTRFY